MNLPRFPVVNEPQDTLRPREEFWGPIRLYRDGILLDAVAYAEMPSVIQLPQVCPICSSLDLKGTAVVYGWPVYECRGCGVGFVWPQPSDDFLRRYYGPDFWASYMAESRPLYERPSYRRHILLRQAQCLNRLLLADRSARILDMGTGDGSMLRVLKDLGFRNLVGIEIDPVNARRAQDLSGLEVRCQDFLTLDEGGWDAITLWATIEHLKDPVKMFCHAARLLTKGGITVVMTGDNDSLCARLQRCFDIWMAPPGHLFYFDSRSICTVFEKSGFVDVHCRLGFQGALKERVLLLTRLAHAVKAMLRRDTRPAWRSVNSNLLVAWGRRRA